MPQLSLTTRGRRVLAVVVGVGVLGGAALGILRWFEVARARQSDDRATLERAARWAPEDAALQHRLGRWEQFSLAEGDVGRAVLRYRRAAELNPYESRYWLDLAETLLLTGEAPAAEAAANQAVQVDPRTPRTLWRVGNFWLRTPEPARAFPYLRQALAADPRLAPLVIQVAHRAFRDPDRLLRELLPLEPSSLLAYLRELIAEGETESPAAARVWGKLFALGQAFPVQRALPYMDFLLRHRELPQAEKVWRDLQSLRLVPAGAEPSAEERLHNPFLQASILSGGFDWRIEPAPNVSVTLGPGRQGEQPPAVVLLFTGEENLDYRHFYQFALVEPNRRYRFQAWMSTEDITTESGPRLQVVDAYDGGRVLGQSPGLVGTNDWRLETVEFVAGPETRLVRVGLRRLPSRRVSNAIRGRLRAAEFSLRAVGDS